MSKTDRERWTPERTAAAVSALHGHGDLRAASFGVVHGYLDFRGLPLTDVTEAPVAQAESTTLTEITGYADLQGVSWDGLDLSDASMRSTRFTDSTVSRCLFVGTDLADLRMWNTQIDRSVFDRADLTDAAVGTWYDGKGCSFTACTFVRTKVKDLMSDAGEFRDCVFDVRLRDVQFLSTVFENCTFKGSYRQVLFDGRDLRESTGRPGRNTMSGCDFTEADLSDVAFTAIDVRAMRLPQNDDTMIVERFPENVAKALAWIDSPAADDLPDVGRELLRDMLLYTEPAQLPPDASAWFNLADYRHPEMPQFEPAMRAALLAAQS